ncbi:DUF4270 domain-containing protein [Chryseobacterium oryctis]|uniref:DUF4270 domain-containing protein n=1 Tax=Chryseobacterium oryctis TaxID=2952618 RepID=A0ABT3HRJ4_9FLAO|nr:DUF4270 domain-containing protein [Chryseobacterium oryctis]MCW3162395.1 DUF4270 domain-containing protein [Chryseobacterium oryctis]
MTYTIKRTFAVLFLAIMGSALLYNCEPDPDSLGEQLFLDGAAQGNEKSFDLIAYNINNLDTIQSDASKLTSAVLGAFNESQFGMQKASYLTQLRLSTYDPDFGANAVVDSVVLAVKPTYASDSVTTTTNEDYMHPDPAGNIAAKKVVNTYPANKYGKAKTSMTIKVHEVSDFLDGYTDKASSGTIYNVGSEIGSKVFDGNVNLVTITKDSDASSIYTSSAVGVRVNLDPTFFQNKIIAKKGQPELKDVSNFIRYFRGLRISVAEDDGYLMQFSPNDLELVMYYKYDKTENGTTTRPQTTYKFDLGAGNTHIGSYVYNRIGTPAKTAIEGSNPTLGDARLYTQGMGGASIGVKFPETTINQLKELYQKDKAAIISAKIRIYTDSNAWTSKYYKPTAFTITQRDIVDGKEKFTFTNDLLKLSGLGSFALYKAYDLDKNPTYYDFTVTQSVKDIVEGEAKYADKYLKIDMGSFLQTASGTLAGQQYTSRAYTRDRAVFVGTEPGNANRIQLRVIYGTK